MPIYEYRCETCGHQEEFLQKVSEPPLTQCPACRSNTFSKMLLSFEAVATGATWDDGLSLLRLLIKLFSAQLL